MSLLLKAWHVSRLSCSRQNERIWIQLPKTVSGYQILALFVGKAETVILPQELLHIAPSHLPQSWRPSLPSQSVVLVRHWLPTEQNPNELWGQNVKPLVVQYVCYRSTEDQVKRKTMSQCRSERFLYPAALSHISISSGSANSSGWFASASFKKQFTNSIIKRVIIKGERNSYGSCEPVCVPPGCDEGA